MVACALAILLVASFDCNAETVLHTAAETANAIFGKEFISAPFSLTGQVAYVRYRSWLSTAALVIADASGSVVVHADTETLPFTPRPGDILHVEGHTKMPKRPRTFAVVQKFELVSHGTPPKAQPAKIREILSGRLDSQLTSITGTVRDVCQCDLSPQWTILTLGGDGGTLYVSVPTQRHETLQLEELIGSTVSLTGVSVPSDLSDRKQIGRTYKVADIRSIIRLPTAAEPSRILPDIRDIRNLRPEEIAALGRHRAIGTVLAIWGENRSLVRMDGDLLTRIEFDKGRLPACGDRIEVTGFPESDLFHVNLIRATWKPLPANGNHDEAPLDVTSPRHLLADAQGNRQIDYSYHGRCIRIRGTVIGLPSVGSGNGRLLLQADGFVFPVEATPSTDAFDGIRLGSEVEIVGTCIMEMEDWRPNAVFSRIKGFFIVPHSAADVCIVSNPPWWTARRLTVVIGTLLAALVAIFFWNTSLRRIAERRGRELMREQVERIRATLKTEERTRLAVELHDTLAQNLTGVTMELEAAKRLIDAGKASLLPHLELGSRTLKSCRDELRNCLWDLRSRALEEPDMNTAILRTLKPHADSLSISVRFNVPRRRLSDNLAHGLLRIVRELVINAIRHGRATSVLIAGVLDGNTLRCSVRDNGRGFDPGNAPGILKGHFGLQGIRERIRQLGGTFELDSTPGKGTNARITLETDHPRTLRPKSCL